MRDSLLKGKKEISNEILKLGALVEEAIYKAVDGLKNMDAGLSKLVAENDGVINSLSLKIEDDCISLMAVQGPVARDLRELVSTMKIARDLERIGDHAVHIAKAVLKSDGLKEKNFNLLVEKMAKNAAEMLNLSLSALVKKDSSLARQVGAMDKRVDEDHIKLMELVTKQMIQSPANAKTLTEYLFISRFAERLGDHVRNICEDVLYIINGRHEGL